MPVTSNDCHGITDEELVKKSLENIDYFACIYERYEEKLIRYILRISSFSYPEAEEILQDAFVKIWRNLNEFDDSLKFSSWVYRIVHNTTINEWHKSQSKGKHQKQEIDDELYKNLPSSLNLEKELGKKVDKESIKHVLRMMPEKYSSVLILKFLEEKDYNEISDILKKPKGTVATLINRAKKSFFQVANKEKISF